MNSASLKRSIEDGCNALGEPLSPTQLAQMQCLLQELQRWGTKINLTAIRDPAEMVSGHLLDSLAVRSHLHGKSVVDIGTGAGFPGLPLAIAEPDRSFVLLDGNRKKVSFVQHVVTTLKLQNVTALHCRAENYAPEQAFDTVVARALASIPRIIELGAHLLAKKGVLLALKGQYPADELEQTKKLPEPWDWKVCELRVPGLQQRARHVARLERKSRVS